jgi:hypothetical protein
MIERDSGELLEEAPGGHHTEFDLAERVRRMASLRP